MIRSLPTDQINYVLGGPSIHTRPLPPYDNIVCAFLGTLSSQLMADSAAKKFPDVMTFAFWCRRAHIQKLKADFGASDTRLGRGLAFHIAPSNVPVNFAFSYAFGLLSGNANIVRVASNDTAQATIICSAIDHILSDPAFDIVREMTAIVRYPADNKITEQFSALADGRVIWGGDQTIASIRSLDTPPRCVDLAFADRTSFCVIDVKSVDNVDDATMSQLVQNFYNDTYLMDQNACSSPHLVVWHGVQSDTVRAKFWDALEVLASQSYALEAVQAVDKHTATMQAAIDIDEADRITQHGINVVRINLADLPLQIENTRGQFGLFFEHTTDDLSPLAEIISPKFQTLTYFGMDKNALSDFVTNGRLRGIDRIVPVGRALAIDVMWDGYDVVRHLSRVVALE